MLARFVGSLWFALMPETQEVANPQTDHKQLSASCSFRFASTRRDGLTDQPKATKSHVTVNIGPTPSAKFSGCSIRSCPSHRSDPSCSFGCCGSGLGSGSSRCVKNLRPRFRVSKAMQVSEREGSDSYRENRGSAQGDKGVACAVCLPRGLVRCGKLEGFGADKGFRLYGFEYGVWVRLNKM